VMRDFAYEETLQIAPEGIYTSILSLLYFTVVTSVYPEGVLVLSDRAPSLLTHT
jgi:hypothetical protein